MRAPMLSPPRESVSDLGGSKSEMGHRDFCGFSPIQIRVTGKKTNNNNNDCCVKEKAKTLGKASKEREREGMLSFQWFRARGAESANQSMGTSLFGLILGLPRL